MVGSGGKTTDNFTVSGTESQDVVSLLQQRMSTFSGAQMQVVFATPGMAKVTDAQPSAQIEQVLAELKGLPRSRRPYLANQLPGSTIGLIEPRSSRPLVNAAAT
ncbi:hypothetical protein OIE68_06940 [Nocardia vinacea]|uniref:MMPL family protein n=1 Tax=Nocardia vinacea TaxID=96468 RepID=A0ABZ1YTW2_9NOCA|nr:hypothetical protein OIE68_06940 [Nocardia vinacea]